MLQALYTQIEKEKFIKPENEMSVDPPDTSQLSELQKKNPGTKKSAPDLELIKANYDIAQDQQITEAAPIEAKAPISDKAMNGGDDGSGGLVSKVAAPAMDLFGDIVNRENRVAESRQESFGAGMNTTAKAASLGMAAFGPAGAGIGAAAGIVYSSIKSRKDAEKRAQIRNEAYTKASKVNTAQRERDQLVQEGEEQVRNLKNLNRAQLGMINYQ